MMKKLFLLLLSVMATSSMLADGISQEQALQKAQAFLNGKTGHAGAKRVKAVGLQKELKAVADEGLYYAFNVGTEDGFVIVSGDDRTPDILGYSDSGSLDPGRLPDNLRAWLAGYADQLRWLKENGGG